MNATPHIDAYMFERQLESFIAFVEEKSGVPFVSFAANPYTEQQEGYKYDVYRAGRGELGFQNWAVSDIGTGRIGDAAIRAIELEDPANNLAGSRQYGDQGRLHFKLVQARDRQEGLEQIEECLFNLYREDRDEEAYAGLVEFFGQKYPLVAYLCFLKDRTKYLPIAPECFDKSFQYLGVHFWTSGRCSWENYTTYLSVIGGLRGMLAESLGIEVALLDAHAFAWMLADQMSKANRTANLGDYSDLPASERDAIVKARVGQGRFRQSLLDYWSSCAVTGCTEAPLLVASHIKPWAESALPERLDLFNGLLLAPALDACFDAGYITFDDDGRIMVSSRLTEDDAVALGIHRHMRLRQVDPRHRPFLAYHREHVFA